MKNNLRFIELDNTRPIRVLFICLGNICRSPAAEGILRQIVEDKNMTSEWVIDSAGIGGWHVGQLPDKRMRIHARQRGLELSHRCRQIQYSDFDDFDIIIGMDSSNITDLRELAPTLEASRKIVHIDTFIEQSFGYDHVPDPYYEGAEGFELVLDILESACFNIYETLTKIHDI